MILRLIVMSLVAAPLVLLAARPAVAAPSAPAASVQGTVKIGDRKIALKHACAHFHDNAEGLLDLAQELRVVVTDVEVPPESIRGIAFLPVEDLARKGEVHGLVIKLDPGQPNSVVITLLDKPEEEGASLLTLTRSVTGQELWKSFAYAPGQASGELVENEASEHDEHPLTYAFKFSAPVVDEPAVTADLKGKAALASPQVAVLRAKAKAMAAGDLEAMKKSSSVAAAASGEAHMAQMGLSPEAMKAMMKEYAPSMLKDAGAIQRVVVRGDRAVAFSRGESESTWFNFVLENGEWKSDD